MGTMKLFPKTPFVFLRSPVLVLGLALLFFSGPVWGQDDNEEVIEKIESTGQSSGDEEDEDKWPGTLIPFVALMLPVMILWVIFGYSSRKDRLRYETILKLSEQGLEVPPELLIDEDHPKEQVIPPAPEVKRSDLRKGILTLFLGLGIGVAAHVLFDSVKSTALRIILVFLGLGYLVAWMTGADRDPEKKGS